MSNFNNQKAYETVNNNERLLIPSYMGIVPSDSNIEITEEFLRSKISTKQEFIIDSVEKKEIENLAVFEVDIKYGDQLITVFIAKRLLKEINLKNFSFANGIKNTEYETALLKDSYIEISVLFSDNAIDSYLFQLKLLYALAPDTYIGIDFSSMSIFSTKWLQMITDANIAPAQSYLYSIKTMYNDETKTYWIRTEGLLRCGFIELELVEIKNGKEEMTQLLQIAANLLIECNCIENQKFQIGYDGLGIFLCWLRWEDALKDFPQQTFGGFDYRKNSNNPYRRPSGILYAAEDNNLVSVEVYTPIIKKQPILFITATEATRKRKLALSQWLLFKKAFRTFGKKEEGIKSKSFFAKIFGKKEDQDKLNWMFLVKLSFETNKPNIKYQKEHLWFEVLEINNDQIKAKLCNKAYGIDNLKKGDIKTYSVTEFISDWLIYDPEDYEYTPDSAYLLEDEINNILQS